MVTGRVLWTGVILLSGLAWVNCEMRKSWKVKSSSSDAIQSVMAPPEPDELGRVLAKMPRFEPQPELDAEPEPEPEVQEAKVDEISVQPKEERAEPKVDAVPEEPPAKTQVKNRLRSTYIANRTPSVYYNSIRESVKAAPFIEDHEPEIQVDDFSADEIDDDDYDLGGLEDNHDQRVEENKYEEDYKMIESILEEVKISAGEQQPVEKVEEKDQEEPFKSEDFKKYDFGPVLNMTIDEPNNIVNVKLNEKVLKDIFTGRQGGGGNKKMWKYAMPLFILPFLIQSAIIPFMLTTVKLFLLKSFMAGKLAILLLLLGAFKNFTHKKDKDVYVKDLPERRYEPHNEWPYPYQSEGRPGWNN
ncbi:uncharacterized protein Osi22 [Ochlerotatus camptorhynchus]|uniref:uncharacterized protein Osi22 n=1 Tax=Ochlerotatus camptorhynchus TaxID=644619 RepID=UPI0031DA52CD